MILQALAEYGRGIETHTPGYRASPIKYVVVVSADGSNATLEPLGTADQDFVLMSVPVRQRSGTAAQPILAVDKAQYALGVAPVKPSDAAATDKVQEATTRNHGAFKSLLRSWVERSDDQSGRIVLAWFDAGMPGIDESLSSMREAQDSPDRVAVAFRVEGAGYLHDEPSARTFWWDHVYAPSARGLVGPCAACCQHLRGVKKMPRGVHASAFPGTDSTEVPLVSANFAAAMRGCSGEGMATSVLCVECADAAVAAIEDLASRESSRLGNPGGKEPLTIWWTDQTDAPVGIKALLDRGHAEPAELRTWLDGVYAGAERTAPASLPQFRSLTYSRTKGRFVVHDWIDTPLLAVEKNVAGWFDATRTRDPRNPHPSIPDMARATGLLTAKAKKDTSEPVHGAAAILWRAAVCGGPVSPLIAPALHRMRAEIRLLHANDAATKSVAWRRFHARAGLFRLALQHNATRKGSPMTDASQSAESQGSEAYRLGQLFGLLQNLQRAALGSNLNSTITDAYFTKASTAPASVYMTLLQKAQRHLKTAGGAGFRINEEIAHLVDSLGPHYAFPTRLTRHEQLEWALGFYHQTARTYERIAASKDCTAEAENDSPDDQASSDQTTDDEDS